MLLIDSHVHSHHSRDSRQTMEEIYCAAVEKGLTAVAVTDHADLWFLKKEDTFNHIAASTMEARLANGLYEGEVCFLTGIELADQIDGIANAKKLLGLTEYDVVLASVHCVEFEEWEDNYAFLDFGEGVSEEKLREYLAVYFDKVLLTAQSQEFDVLSHLTCPLRYINGKFHRNIGLEEQRETITEILKAVIDREKSLEVNTSGLGKEYGDLLPDRSILEEYYALGGRRITLGSDGHTPDGIANGFAEAIEILKEIGFEGYTYYAERKPRFVAF